MTTAADFDKKYDIVDCPTPRHAYMSGRYKQSFAYYTLRERLPVILTHIIDNLTRDKDELAAERGEASREEIKNVIGLISKLKYELQTDKLLKDFNRNEPDKEVWNDFLHKLPYEKRTFFRACWLYAECYMYRKISSFFESTESLRSYDYFSKQKMNAMVISEDVILSVLQNTRQLERSSAVFQQLLKLNLWGNRCDLSITQGREIKQCGNPFEQVASYEPNLLIDETAAIWNCITTADQTKPVIVNFINDNAGYELFTDLIVAEYLIDKNLASKVRFNVKAIPWFISDVRAEDLDWALKYFSGHSSQLFKDVGRKWTQYMAEGKFELAPVDYFWTGPYEFYRMHEITPELYSKLSESQLLILKGDLNYRKLLGDYAWDATQDFETCIRGFLPTNICSLRTVKADLICGLREGQFSELNKLDTSWMTSGEYGTIQFCEHVYCGCKPLV